MFSSNPFSQVPSSSTNVFSPPNSFFDHEKDELHFNHHKIHNPFISGDNILFHSYNSPAPPPLVTQNIEGSGLQDCEEDHDDLLDSVISPYKKKIATLKKDGHSKIYTARGPRDRRVRLSIEIARKFFCLQDLLRFDKASKTLDWLLTKSLTAIKDLVEETYHCSSSTLTDQSKVKFLETIKKDSDEESCQKKKSVVKFVDGQKKKRMQRCKGGSQENFAKDQSRAEARARARERTKEKMRVKKLDDDLKTLVNSDGCESGCWGQIETQNDYQETSKQSQDPNFQNKYLALPNIRAFQGQQGDNSKIFKRK